MIDNILYKGVVVILLNLMLISIGNLIVIPLYALVDTSAKLVFITDIFIFIIGTIVQVISYGQTVKERSSL